MEEEEPMISNQRLVFQTDDEREEELMCIRQELEGDYTVEEREQKLDESIRRHSRLYN